MKKLSLNTSNIVLYKNIDLKKAEILNTIDWSRKNNKNFSCMHSVASYLAMFAPSLPEYFIKKYSRENDFILDSFSGRGTTGLVCRELNRNFIGNDLNPYAIVLSRMKIEQYKKNDLLNKLSDLEQEFNLNKRHYFSKKRQKKYRELSTFYSNKNLVQLIFLRNKLGKNWQHNLPVENAILAYACGLMHGPSKKNGDTIYFSLDMPNAISMSHNYVKNYSVKKQLIKPKNNIFNLIRNRINDKFDNLVENPFKGKIFYQNAVEKNLKISNDKIDLVITSPPYLNVVNYTLSNWLKLWLLGYERAELRKQIILSDNLKYDDYLVFIEKYLISIYPNLKNKCKVCLIVGDYYHEKIIEGIWKKIKNKVPYRFVEIYYDNKYKQNYKSTNMLNSRKGLCTKIEKVLVLEKK